MRFCPRGLIKGFSFAISMIVQFLSLFAILDHILSCQAPKGQGVETRGTGKKVIIINYEAIRQCHHTHIRTNLASFNFTANSHEGPECGARNLKNEKEKDRVDHVYVPRA